MELKRTAQGYAHKGGKASHKCLGVARALAAAEASSAPPEEPTEAAPVKRTRKRRTKSKD